MAKFRKRSDGELAEVGDLIVVEHLGGAKSKYKVTRVTANYCFCRLNDVAEMKLTRTMNSSGLRESPRETWGRNSYYAYKPLAEVEQ